MASDVRFVRIRGRVVPIKGGKKKKKPSSDDLFNKSDETMNKARRLESRAQRGKGLGGIAGATAGFLLGARGGNLITVGLGVVGGGLIGQSFFDTDKKKLSKAKKLRSMADKLHNKATSLKYKVKKKGK